MRGYKIYKGITKLDGSLLVRVMTYPLEGSPKATICELRHAIYHSPTGFSAGFGGSGPADLALNILLDLTGDMDKLPALCFSAESSSKERCKAIENTVAWQLHQPFKEIAIALLPREHDWALHSALIAPWVEVHRKPAEYEITERTMYDYMGCTIRALPGAVIRSFGGEYLAIPEGGINFDVIDVRPVSDTDRSQLRPPRLILRQNNWPTVMQDVYTTRLDNIEFVRFPDESEGND